MGCGGRGGRVSGAVGVDGEDADGGGWDADDVVGDVLAAGQGDVGEVESEPGAVVEGAALADGPFHGVDLAGFGVVSRSRVWVMSRSGIARHRG